MIQKTKNKTWKCLYCNKQYPSEEQAMSHRDNHELILVPIAKNDLGRLVQFIFTGADELITPELLSTLQKYLRRASTK